MRLRFVLLALALAACHAKDVSTTTSASRAEPAPPSSTPPSAGTSSTPEPTGTTPPPAPADTTPPPPPPPTDAGADAPAATPAIGFIGRFDTRDAAHPRCAWPGCRIVARFDGTSVSVRLDDEPVSAGAGPSQWDVTIDGAAKPTLVLTQGTSDYSLASGLASGVHTVELYKRSEAQDGVTQLIAFDFGGGTLLAPPPRAGRTIELVGDSQAAGFGVDGVGIVCQPPAWAARYENFHESFGAVLGQLLGADVVGTVFSGKGVARNVWRPDLDTMPVLYKRADPLDGASVQDMGAIAADAVVVVLGGNDFDAGQPTDDGPLPLATFEAAYDGFLTTIRTAHPSAQIFLVVPPTVSDDYPAGRNARTNVIQAVNDLVAKRADPKMHAATPGAAAYSELTGCDGHGNPAYHQRVAKELAAVVGPVMGW